VCDGLQIFHHGAGQGVTGSCHELRLAGGVGMLVDCGMLQGDEKGEGRTGDSEGPPQDAIDFPVDHIRALVATHVHLDHVGRIPYLLAAGFKGPIYCSEPSAILLPLVLEDALKVGVTRDRRLIRPLLSRIESQTMALPYNQWRTVLPGAGEQLDIRLQRAGHILGSAYVECRVRNARPAAQSAEKQARQPAECRVVFSGDLGAPYTPLLPAPRAPLRADLLVLESTYGDRLHAGRKERRKRLRGIIEHSLADRGAVLIPAFSIGRTQELLYELEEVIHRCKGGFAAQGLPWEDLEIIVDSPLAARFTDTYRRLKPYWDGEARRKLAGGRHPLSFEQVTTIDSHRDHLQTVEYLKKRAHPCIVIAASGMCSGGRIVNYLKALLGDPRTDILLVGYQAAGTPGRAIQKYGPGGGYVVLDGRKYVINAKISTLSGYSAHADQQNLVDFVRRMRTRPREIRLVHGDPDARAALAGRLLALEAEA
jgi:metallo-beta-lactamase family protein